VLTLAARTAVAAVSIGLTLGGCGQAVRYPLSPLDARRQVIDAARDIIGDLHGEVIKATFSYESCNHQGQPAFRGVVNLSFWMPGVPHNEPADPQTLIHGLVADGWSTNSDFASHGPMLQKNGINATLSIAPHPPASIDLVRHVGVKVDGECRDTSDHRTDGSTAPVDISNEIQQPW
jgi:hypothetical protein